MGNIVGEGGFHWEKRKEEKLQKKGRKEIGEGKERRKRKKGGRTQKRKGCRY